jgi:hypothetical protein
LSPVTDPVGRVIIGASRRPNTVWPTCRLGFTPGVIAESAGDAGDPVPVRELGEQGRQLVAEQLLSAAADVDVCELHDDRAWHEPQRPAEIS